MSDHESNGSRPFREVLDAALVELWAREKRLVAFETELKEVRRAIAVLEKALGGGSSKGSPSRNGSGPHAASGREEKRAKILATLQEADETLSVREIAEATGSVTVGLDRMLAAMARDGAIAAYPNGRYGVTRGDKARTPLAAAVLDAAGIEQG